jgi:hypothetical protein
MICSRLSSPAILCADFESVASTLFFNVVTGGFELIFLQLSSFLSIFIPNRRQRRSGDARL